MTTVFIDTESLKVHSVDGYPFLIIEPMGNLQFADYKALLSSPEIFQVITHSQLHKVYLELNGLWTVGTEQQEWTVGEFATHLKAKGVTKLAIGLAAHVYPTFSLMAAVYEKQAAIPTKYFPDLDQMVEFLA